MSNILAFAASNSSTSINHQLVSYVTSLIKDHHVQVIKMTDFPFPMYSADIEKKEGFSNSMVELNKDIKKMDALIISVNEHNGGLSAYAKNLLDWFSRLDRQFLSGKKVFLLGASTGRGGAVSAITQAESILPRFGAEIMDTFSLPSFSHNFSNGKITDEESVIELKERLETFLANI
ncbi:NADPH-dependent FMN reductase [Sungkyunkwania multivorans]|uniref:NADPH-dependent FMN reductase n=1 Tax=Sungkyunkwania multivorans TaxID=1173618 RepID=A0ABW3CUK1_9FLAO